MAERPSLPEGLEADLHSIRPSFRLVWNVKARVVNPGSYDVYGLPTPVTYEPRWELWDTTPDGNDYMVMQLREPDGGFRQPGSWLVHHLNLINPERYGGDVNRMLTALAEDPNASIATMAEHEFEDIIEMATKWHIWRAQPKQSVLTNIS